MNGYPPYGGYAQPNAPHGMPPGGYYGAQRPPRIPLRQQPVGRQIRQLSLWGGISVLLFFFIQQVVAFALHATGLSEFYQGSELFRQSFGVLYSLVCVGTPFLLVCTQMKKVVPGVQVLPLGKPVSAKLFLLAIPMGIAGCFAGSYATGILVNILSQVGIHLTQPESTVPTGALALAVYILGTAAVPALIEEFALRGVILQPLRRFGNWFAILMSSLIFALMHGNLVQAPFAFIAGITIGYLVICTGSMWTGVLIHFFNNLLSVVQSIILDRLGTMEAVLFNFLFFGLIAAGVICAIFFFRDRGRPRFSKPDHPAPLSGRIGQYLFTPAMVIALLVIVYETSQYVGFGR